MAVSLTPAAVTGYLWKSTPSVHILHKGAVKQNCTNSQLLLCGCWCNFIFTAPLLHLKFCKNTSKRKPEGSSPFVNVGPMCSMSAVFTARKRVWIGWVRFSSASSSTFTSVGAMVYNWWISKALVCVVCGQRSWQILNFSRDSCLCHVSSVQSLEPLVEFGEQSWRTPLLHAASVSDDRLNAFLRGSGVSVDVQKACFIVRAIRNTCVSANWKSKNGRLGANLMTKHCRLNHLRGNLPLRRLIMTTPKTFSGMRTCCQVVKTNKDSVFPTEGFVRPRTQVRWFGRKLSKLLAEETKVFERPLSLLPAQAEEGRPPAVSESFKNLSSCMTLAACATVYEAAWCITREDERLLLEVRPSQADLIAKEICYHKGCYAKYSRQKNVSYLVTTESREGRWSQEPQDALEPIWIHFLNWQMNGAIFDSQGNGNVASESELCSSYVVFLRKEGMLLSSYRVDRLNKHMLQNHFQTLLSFFNLQRELLNQTWLLLALFHRVYSSIMRLKTCIQSVHALISDDIGADSENRQHRSLVPMPEIPSPHQLAWLDGERGLPTNHMNKPCPCSPRIS